MKLNKLNFLKENIRNLYSSGVIYLGLLIFYTADIGYILYSKDSRDIAWY
ncbi:Uncharacterised protein [Streptococcus pneumoniae]|nr:Uncharacterised protein [Streptococcus pneumoniae]